MMMRNKRNNILQVLLLCEVCFTYIFGFNVDTNFPIIYEDFSHNSSLRSSYFGFSVLISNSWIEIGAPRANFSGIKVLEPGVAYHCKFDEPCQIISLGNPVSRNVPVSDKSWFGVSMDFQSGHNGQIVICGHRWINSSIERSMSGACFSFQPDKDFNSISNILTPTSSGERKKKFLINNNKPTAYKDVLSQTGMSVHFTESKLERSDLLLGAPGFLNWKGSAVKCNKLSTCSKDPMITDPISSDVIVDFDLFGYQVSSGHFFSHDKLLYVASAPRGDGMKGFAMIFKFPEKNFYEPKSILKISGENIGDYFGCSIAVADITGDGRDELIVGAPFFTQNGDEGRIYISEFNTDKSLKTKETRDGKKEGGRFGTAVASLGDLDQDGFADIAVGAPYEGNGAIYIYYGRSDGLNGPVQRISAEDVHSNIRGFGISFSGQADIDGNKYNDVAVGSFLSGHAVIFRTRPVVILQSRLFSLVQQLSVNVTKVSVRACVQYTGTNIPDTMNITRKLSVDDSYKRAEPQYLVNTLELHGQNEHCNDISFSVMFKENLVHQSMDFSLSASISSSKSSFKSTLFVKENGKRTGDDRFSLQDPVQKMLEGSSEDYLSIPYSQDCSNIICQPDLKLNCSILQNGKIFNLSQPFIIGSSAKYQLKIEVVNAGEPSYTSHAIVKFPKEIRLASMPYTCNEKQDMVSCQLGVIRNKNDKRTHTLDLDMSSIGQLNIRDVQTMHITVNITTSAHDVDISNNFKDISINLALDVDAHIYGKSQKESYPVLKAENGSFASELEVVQMHEVRKKGLSPLRELSLYLKVPAKMTIGKEEIEILSIYQPEAIIDDKYWSCKGNTSHIDSEFSFPSDNDYTDILVSQNEREKRSLQDEPSTEKAPPSNRTLYINCSMEQVDCITIKCQPTELQVYGKVTLRLSVKIAKLGPLMGLKDIIYITSEGNIQILNPDTTSIRNVQQKWGHTSYVSSTIIGKIPERKVDLWIIVSSAIGGILLAVFIAMGLAKAGFFQRQKKADLQELMEKERNSQMLAETDNFEDEELEIRSK